MRDRRRGENPEGQPAPAEDSPAHADPRIAAMAQRWVQRRAKNSSPPAGESAERELDAADHSGGAPLPEKAQRKFESSLGTDLSGVRVHTGTQSAVAAEAVGARAYTVGKNIHFGAGEYDPEKNEELLAHEVAHTVQQSGHPQRQHKLQGGSGEDSAELDADAAAARMVEGAPARVSAVAPGLHRKPDQAAVDQLKKDLQEQIEQADWWNKLRPKLYPKASAANKADAKERKAGTKADLTGLGKITTLDHFAAAVKALQPKWNAHGTHHSLAELKKAINTEMTGVGVPALKHVQKDPTGNQAKGYFVADEWNYYVNAKLIDGDKLSDADAEELCNTTIHEARHAEQHFLAARYAAGVENQSADDIVAAEGIPSDIAAQAVAQKFDAKTDPAVADKGKEMFDAMVTNKDANNQIEGEVQQVINKDMPAAKTAAQGAVKQLDSPSDDNVAKAQDALTKLKDVLALVEKEYGEYRSIPFEADAHDVGDAAGLAFEGWPK